MYVATTEDLNTSFQTEQFLSNEYIIYKDVFGIPYKRKMITNHGYFIRYMQTGFYKMYWMNIVNSELYIFNDRESDEFIEMHVLAPQTYVTKM